MEILILKGVLLLSSAFFNLVLAFLLFKKGRENKAAFHLGLTAIFSALYCFTCAITDLSWKGPFSYSTKLFWNRSTWLGTFILPAYLNFVYYFTDKTKYIKIKSFLWYLGATIIGYLALFTSYFIESIQIGASIPVEKPGILEPFGRLYIILATTLGLIYILREYFQSKGYRRLQLKYFILGIVVYSIGGIIFTGVLPLIQGTSQYFDITALLSSVWVGLTSYAISRYHLMDIRILLGKGVAFLLLFISTLFAAFLLVLVNSYLPTPLSFFQLLPFILALTVILLQLNKFYEGLAEIYFYPAFSERKMIIENLEEELTRLLEIKTFSLLIVQSLKRAFELEKIAILTKVPGRKSFNLQKQFGFEKEEVLTLSKDEFLLSLLRKFKKPFGVQEAFIMLEKIKDETKIIALKRLKEKMEKLEIGLFIPLLFERKVIGIIILGEKAKKEAFTKEDMDLLTTLSRQASIALRNTLLYSEIRKRKEALERFYRLTVGRELKMIELKKKILELEKRLGRMKKS